MVAVQDQQRSEMANEIKAAIVAMITLSCEMR
jgi:hypothetical protein